MNRLAVSAMLLLAWAAPMAASMVIDRTIIRFDPNGSNRQDVLISNTGAETLYLTVEVFEVKNPGAPSETREKAHEPSEIGLLATPNRMIVPAGARKLVRLVNLRGRAQEERIYRVNVTPVVGEVKATGVAVNIVVAYQLLVIVRPEKPAADLDWVRTGKQVVFTNRGNTNALLHTGEQCSPDPAADAECVTLTAHRLYAGNVWELTVPYDAPLEYSVTIGEGNTRKRFD